GHYLAGRDIDIAILLVREVVLAGRQDRDAHRSFPRTPPGGDDILRERHALLALAADLQVAAIVEAGVVPDDVERRHADRRLVLCEIGNDRDVVAQIARGDRLVRRDW